MKIENLNKLTELYSNFVKDNEIEARFGTFGGTFKPTITLDQYDRIFSFFDSKKEFYQKLVINQKIEYYDSDIRKVVSDDGNVQIITKKKIENFDIKNYNMRIGISSEKPAYLPVDKNVKRTVSRKRISFIYEQLRFDLDKNQDGEMSIELESKHPIFDVFLKNIVLILNILQDSELIISNDDAKDILNYYKKFSLKFIGIKPHTIKIDKLNKNDTYACTKKLDGKRFVMFAENNQVYLMSDNMKDFKKIPYFYNSNKSFLIDGEYFGGSFYAFDLISNQPRIVDRIETIKGIYNLMTPHHENVGTKIFIKDYIYGDLFNSMTALIKVLDDKYEDGIIVIKDQPDYFKSTPLKWKKVEKITIDFTIKKKNGIFTFYAQGITKLQQFAKNQVDEPAYSKYKDGDIVECYWNDKWIPLLIRSDKLKPNFINVANDNWESIKNPFNIEDLTLFTSRNTSALINMRRFHNFIKRNLLCRAKNSTNGHSVLDLASGKGGDFGKYRDMGLSYVEGYDIDQESVEESKIRSVDIAKDAKNSIEFKLTQLDLNAGVLNTSRTFDIITCNFAFHYFYNNLGTIIQTLQNNSKIGTKLVMTLFDGKKVKEQNNGSFKLEIIDGGKVKVYIKDSVLEEPAVEYIVDLENLISILSTAGFSLDENTSFKDLYPEWVGKSRLNVLSSDEKALSFMNNALVFSRVHDNSK